MMTAHLPVLLDEVVAALLPQGRTAARIVDGTLGAGGHTRALLQHGAQEVLGLDLDPQAIAIAREILAPWGARVRIVHASYADMPAIVSQIGWAQVDGVLLDLGASSMQFDTPERGFAFRHQGPLDMRFDPTSPRPTAADIINNWDETSLADLFYRYGEESKARQLARRIVTARPFHTTTQLADFIAQQARPTRASAIHPATRIFQALRIAVNEELQAIETVLPAAIGLLRSGGRLAVISFHSLEDRIVKTYFKEASQTRVPPPGMASMGEKRAQVALITRKPLEASPQEVTRNPRSRSAKLRVVEKL